METSNVSNVLISTIKGRLKNQLLEIRENIFNGKSILIVEKKFLESIGQAGSCGISELFLQNDKKSKIIEQDSQKYYLKYYSRGRYLTLLGEISLKRSIYQSNYSKRSICPLENKLKFINDYVSFGAVEYIAYNIALMTPQDFVKHSNKWTFMNPSQSTIKKTVSYVGEFLENSDFYKYIQAKEKIAKEAVTLAISMDSTSVLVRKTGWKHATAGTLSTYDPDGNRLNTTYIGQMPEKNKTTFKNCLAQEVNALRKKQTFSKIVCIADGAKEIWNYFRKQYPDAICILDYFHAVEHLSKLSELLFKNSSEAEVWFKKYRHILKNDPNGAAKVIRAVRYKRSLIPKNKNVERELKYLQNNRGKMNYFEYKKNNLPIGSGVIEAACKNLIGARLKKSGMSWSIKGGQYILDLRALILSNRWEIFWEYFMRSHFPELTT
jgi:hypothetical protein